MSSGESVSSSALFHRAGKHREPLPAFRVIVSGEFSAFGGHFLKEYAARRLVVGSQHELRVHLLGMAK